MTERESASYTRGNVREAVLGIISSRGSAGTSEIARAAGVSDKAARGYINEPISEGIVEGLGSQNSPKRRYRLAAKRG